MENILDVIKKARHVTVVAHIHPDADSVGSASALYTYMLQLHKKVTFYCATKAIDPALKCIPWVDKIKHTFPKSSDLVLSADCGNKCRLGEILDVLLINFDHHASNELFGNYNIVNKEAVSTSQVVFDFFVHHNITINSKIATALYAGLLDDSRNFLNSKVDEKTFNMAAFLCARGAKTAIVANHISKQIPLSAFRLKAAMMSNMQLVSQAHIALFIVPLKMLDDYGAHHRDCKLALEEGLYLPSVEVSLLLCENRDLSIKGSLRSKGKIDVNMIAQKFGGGGHIYSAGFKINNQSLEKASDTVLGDIDMF